MIRLRYIFQLSDAELLAIIQMLFPEFVISEIKNRKSRYENGWETVFLEVKTTYMAAGEWDFADAILTISMTDFEIHTPEHCMIKEAKRALTCKYRKLMLARFGHQYSVDCSLEV